MGGEHDGKEKRGKRWMGGGRGNGQGRGSDGRTSARMGEWAVAKARWRRAFVVGCGAD